MGSHSRREERVGPTPTPPGHRGPRDKSPPPADVYDSLRGGVRGHQEAMTEKFFVMYLILHNADNILCSLIVTLFSSLEQSR